LVEDEAPPTSSQPRLAQIDPAARARLVEAYSPGARVVRARRLRGGLGARTQVLDIEDASGRRSKVVLRVYLPGRRTLTPEDARREFRTIEMVHTAGVPSPEPLFLDAVGVYLGEPAMLLQYLPGRSLYRSNGPAWAEELARAMVSIHAVTPDRYDPSWLPPYGRKEVEAELVERREAVAVHEDDLAREVLAVLENSLDRVVWVPSCLIHDDFWPGNTVWYRGKLTGVIDWADACWGDPRVDLPQCRIDAYLANDHAAEEAVVEAYARLSSHPMPDQWFFDLIVGLRALLYYDIWLAGYHDAGLKDVTKERSRERIHDFLRRAMHAGGWG
jgi:aminoglycoside phosphotransferase (APT) family kinase protein